jgi:lysophospholipase L1-like esterase
MMLQTLQDRKVPVLLIAVPDLGIPGFLSDSDIYSELAEKYRVPLLEDKLSSLESRNKYKSDSIHLNAQGYRLLAEAIAAILKESGAI